MTHKQEVIKIIADGLPTKADLYYHECLAYAEGIYDRIVPLMRGEFPEERLEDLIKEWHTKADNNARDKVAAHVRYRCAEELERLLDYFKRENGNPPILVKGARYRILGVADKPIEFTAGDGVIIELSVTKGTCQKCGGIGRVPREPPQYISAKFHDNPCPQCGGNGKERRSGGERREDRIVRRVICWYPNGTPCRLIEIAGWEYKRLIDRRILRERRKA